MISTTPARPDELDLPAKFREVVTAGGFTWMSLREAGIVNNRQTVNGWLTTGRISKANLGAVSDFTGIPMDWWLSPKGLARPSAKQMLEAAKSGKRAELAPATGARTPVVGEARLGADGYYEETPYVAGSDGWVDYPARDGAYSLRCKGDSMRPRIEPGEFVVVKPKRPVKEGDYVVVQTVKGARMIKTLNRRRNGTIELTSINHTDTPPMTFDEDDIEHMHYVAAICRPDEYYPDPA